MTRTAAVLIATYNRPELLETCLEHLEAQTVAPDRVVVIDSSPDDRSAAVVRDRPDVRYLRNPLGRGHLALSRALGVAATDDVDVIVFIDDDAFADPDWLERLLLPYDDPRVGAVGGRASNGVPGEEAEGWEEIGRFLPDGTLTGNFAADPGHDVDVDHLLGANMSFRLSALRAIGGIQDFYPGTALREDADTALRLRMAGYRVVYTPTAHVIHVAGTYAKGHRFDARYVYFAHRNHLVLLGRVLGPTDRRFRRYTGVAVRQIGDELRYAGRSLRRRRVVGPESIASGVVRGVVRAASTSAGLAVGLGLVLGGRIPRSEAGAAPITDAE